MFSDSSERECQLVIVTTLLYCLYYANVCKYGTKIYLTITSIISISLLVHLTKGSINNLYQQLSNQDYVHVHIVAGIYGKLPEF